MLDIILEGIIETIIMVLFKFPGAFIRWCFTGFKRPYKDVLFDNSEFNGPVGVVTTVVIVLGIVLLTGCNNAESHNTGNDTVTIERKDSIIPAITDDTLERAIMVSVDSAVNAARGSEDSFLTAYFPPNEFTDTLKTTLFIKHGKPQRIQYTTFEDSGAAYGHEDLYFDDSLGIIRVSQEGNSVFYQCVSPSGRHFRFRKWADNRGFDGHEDPPGAQDFFIGGMLRTAHDLIQLYPDFKFNIPDISLKGSFRLLVMNETMPLYELPDTAARQIKLLKYRARIGFIRSNDIVGNYGDKKWIWYFVKSDTDSGWVVGHPDLVQELTAENGEDWPPQ